MFPVFPLFALKYYTYRNKKYIFAAGGGGNPLFGKKNGLIVFDLMLEEIAYYETEKIIFDFFIHKNEILIVLEENNYEKILFNGKKNKFSQLEIPFFDGKFLKFNGNIFFKKDMTYFLYKNKKINLRPSRRYNVPVLLYEKEIIDFPSGDYNFIDTKNNIIIWDDYSLFLNNGSRKFKFKKIITLNYNREENIITLVSQRNTVYLYRVLKNEIQFIYFYRGEYPPASSALFLEGKLYIVSFHGNILCKKISILQYKILCSIFSILKSMNNIYAFFLLIYIFK